MSNYDLKLSSLCDSCDNNCDRSEGKNLPLIENRVFWQLKESVKKFFKLNDNISFYIVSLDSYWPIIKTRGYAPGEIKTAGSPDNIEEEVEGYIKKVNTAFNIRENGHNPWSIIKNIFCNTLGEDLIKFKRGAKLYHIFMGQDLKSSFTKLESALLQKKKYDISDNYLTTSNQVLGQIDKFFKRDKHNSNNNSNKGILQKENAPYIIAEHIEFYSKQSNKDLGVLFIPIHILGQYRSSILFIYRGKFKKQKWAFKRNVRKFTKNEQLLHMVEHQISNRVIDTSSIILSTTFNPISRVPLMKCKRFQLAIAYLWLSQKIYFLASENKENKENKEYPSFTIKGKLYREYISKKWNIQRKKIIRMLRM